MKTMQEEKSILINYKNSIIINNTYNNNTFSYQIYEEVYDAIINGLKNVEFRLLNDKSSRIKKDDIIIFYVLNNDKLSVKVKVTDKIIYHDINQLWNNKEIVNGNVLNLSKEEFIKTFNNIFGEEFVKSSKIVAIKFKLLEN